MRKHTLLLLLTISILCTNACKNKSPQSKVPNVLSDSIQKTKLLNSERIKLKYGSYGIEVLQNNSDVRISNLYSTHNNQRITRTFAVVIYPKKVASTLLKEHSDIVSGQSIGIVFKNNGWNIIKKNVFFGEISSSNDYSKIYSIMGNITPMPLAIHIYDFRVIKDDNEFPYATIAEVYHPDYLTLNDLKNIYRNTFDTYSIDTSISKEILEIIKDKMYSDY